MLSLSILTFDACKKSSSPPDSNVQNKIMPLGASRVEGASPQYESYRYELWKDLIENGWSFDFIGTRSDATSYPVFSNSSFDMDHEGRSSWTSGQIADELEDWLNQAGIPDIVLLSSPGGNDALQNLPYQETVDNINEIIDTLQAKNPEVTILIEQMAPFHSNFMADTVLADYIDQLRQDVATIATQQSTTSSTVIAVDMYTGFGNALLADNLHYNEAGAVFIATRYYDVLVNVLE